MKILHVLMRFYSYLFTLVTAAFLTGLGAVAFISNQHKWKVDSFIFTDQDLSVAMLAVGIVSGVAVVLAVMNWFRFLLPVVALAILGGMFYGFFWSTWRYAGTEDFQWTIGLVAGAFGSFACSLMEFRRGKK
jgi:hypothetical protein